LDILAANQLGYALYSTYVSPGHPANTARFVFPNPRAGDFYFDWDHVANEVVAILRSEAGRNPHEPGSKSEQALNLLGSWSATTDQPELTHPTHPA